jgi:hypothetical protein
MDKKLFLIVGLLNGVHLSSAAEGNNEPEKVESYLKQIEGRKDLQDYFKGLFKKKYVVEEIWNRAPRGFLLLSRLVSAEGNLTGFVQPQLIELNCPKEEVEVAKAALIQFLNARQLYRPQENSGISDCPNKK